MSAAKSLPPAPVKLPNPEELLAHSRDLASRIYDKVAVAYIGFRREYYGEAHPQIGTKPPAGSHVQKAQLALVAENLLRMVPPAIKLLPLLGDFLDHLEQVADVHSVEERERTGLHHMASLFLIGVTDGIQPWYVEWLLATAQRLANTRHPTYYLEFPWDGLLYLPPEQLSALDRAVRKGDVAAIEEHVKGLGDRLSDALRDPLRAQAHFSFSGPDGKRQRMFFHLKTTVALLFLGYTIAAQARLLLGPPEKAAPPESALAPIPVEAATRLPADG